MGRPSSYTPEVGAAICERLANGESLRSICSTSEFPVASTVYRWLEGDQEFRDKYARARNVGLDLLADEAIEIADDQRGQTDRDRLRVDARKWYLSKLCAKKYGDRMAHDVSGTGGGPIKIEVVTGIHRGPPES